jgi:hypothetical protein
MARDRGGEGERGDEEEAGHWVWWRCSKTRTIGTHIGKHCMTIAMAPAILALISTMSITTNTRIHAPRTPATTPKEEEDNSERIYSLG